MNGLQLHGPTGQYEQLMDEVEIMKINCGVMQVPSSVWTLGLPSHEAPHTSGFAKTHTLLMQLPQIFTRVSVCSSVKKDLLRISVDREDKTSGERQTGLFDGSGDSDGWADARRDRGMSWRWIDRQKESRRRAEIRTKTSVTFCGAFPPPPPLLVDLDPSHTASTVSWCVWPCVCVGLLVGT